MESRLRRRVGWRRGGEDLQLAHRLGVFFVCRKRRDPAGSAGVRVQHADINANDNNSQYMLFCRVGGRAMMQQQQHRPAKQLN